MGMRPLNRPRSSSAKGIDRALRAALVAVAAGWAFLAFTALACNFTMDSAGANPGAAKLRLPLAVAGLLLQAAGCALLLHGLKAFSVWRARVEMSEVIARDAERCGWYLKLRHSFGNRLQMALGLLALGKATEAREYLSQVSESLRTSGAAKYDSSCPELDGVLWRGVGAAKQRGVEVVVLAWDSCHRLGVSILAVSRIIGAALDLAVELALSMQPRPVVYVRNSPGPMRHLFLIEWDSSSVGCEPEACPSGACQSAEPLQTAAATPDIASLKAQAREAGGTLTFGADSVRGFIQLAFPSIHVGGRE
jgi:hypothetical protein